MDDIFSEVTAVISPSVISAIHKANGDTTQMIVAQIQNTFPAVVLHREHERYLLSGSFFDIVAVKGEIQKILKDIEVFNSQSASHQEQTQDNTGTLQDATGEHVNFTSSIRPFRKKRSHFYKLRSSKSAHSIFKKRTNHTLKLDLSALNDNLEKMRLSSQESRSDAENKLTEDDSSSSPPTNKRKSKLLRPHGDFKFFCKVCSFKSARRSHLDKHMRMHKRVRNLIQCNYCDFKTVRLSHLRRHEMVHSSVLHSCKQCSYKTVNRRLLSRHCRLKHGTSQDSNDVVFNCPYCNFVTDQTHYFERHQVSCTKKQSKSMFECSKCTYKTERRQHLYRHTCSVHGSERNYLCHTCGKTFKRKDVFTQHYRTSHEESDSSSSYRCDICEKSFKSHSSLTEHRAIHSDSRLFLCEVCGASFKTRSVQRKHISSIHGNPRSHSCLNCEKRFNTSFAMKRHQKVHVCDKNVPSSSTGRVEPLPSTITSNATGSMDVTDGATIESTEPASTSQTPLQIGSFSSSMSVNIHSLSTSIVVPS